MRVQTAIVTIGLCLPQLTASAAGNVGESALRAAATSVDQIAIHDRLDSTSLPAAAGAMLLNERAAFVARARDESLSTSLSAATSSAAAADEDSSEPHPLMMLLSVAALMAYVIGRRGIQRG